MVLTTLTNVGGDRLPPFSFRNRIINGDMKIDQRNAGAQQIIATTNAYCVDRWIVAPTGNSVAGKQVSSSSGWNYTITGNTAVTALSFKTRLEGNNVLDITGTSVTLSAKISSTTLGSLTWNALYPNNALDNWGTSANNINFANGTFTINSTPVLYTSTFTVNNFCSNGFGIELTTGSFTSGNLSITDVQLESGSVPTSFERLPFGYQLPLCQRYFSKSYNQTVAVGTNVGAGSGGVTFIIQSTVASAGGYFKYPATMRIAAPTLTTYDNAGTASKYSYYSAGWQSGATGEIVSSFDHGFNWQANGSVVSSSFNFDYTANAEIY